MNDSRLPWTSSRGPDKTSNEGSAACKLEIRPDATCYYGYRSDAAAEAARHFVESIRSG